MKVTLTLNELTELVRAHYQLPLTMQLEIADYQSPVAETLLARLRSNGCLDCNGNILPDHKIAAIKLLREVYANANPSKPSYSLLQAKLASEDWQNFISYVRQHGFPPMETADYGCRWK